MATCPSCKGTFEASYCPRDGSRLLTSPPARLIGERYRLLRKVGEGAMGEVYEAEHVLLDRKVAVKLLQRRIATDPEASARLQREARSTTGLAHPNIVDTIDFGFADDGQAFLVMEWLDGENLEVRMARGPVEVETALEITAQACAGLVAAHARGVIHRDLKPANLFLTNDHRGSLLVKVLDFGIAKLALHETKLTATGVLIGTPNYMSPEQAEGEPADERSDVYALGVILYEMLTGTVPFVGETPLSVLHQHTSRLPIVPSARAPDRPINHELDMLVMRCLEKRRDERFATMHELANAITGLRGSGQSTTTATDVITRPAGTAAAISTKSDVDDSLLLPAVRSRRGVLIAIVTSLAVVTAGIVALTRRHGEAEPSGYVDAAVASPTTVVVVNTADASSGDAASADAANVVTSATFLVHGKRFEGTVVARPAVPIAGRPVELSIELGTLDPGLRAAAADGRLIATIEVRYYQDHSLLEESTHPLDASARFTVSPRFVHAAEHHAHIDLLVDGREVDHAQVDLFPELR